MPTYFIAGIDTDSGKSVATGFIAKYMKTNGRNVITQKLSQTGCDAMSEDILTHRRIMHMDLCEFDNDGTTCPYVFSYPASPHLAATIDNKPIDIKKIAAATQKLETAYETILLEGVGGVYVPLNGNYTTLDYLQEKNYPVVLITSSKLGSINHSLLTLDVLKSRGLELAAVLYNHFPNDSEIITNDSKRIIKEFTNQYFPDAGFAELPIVNFEEDKVFDLKDLKL